MKKILLSVAVMAMMSGLAFADTGKKPGSKKAAKTEKCKKACPESKKCSKTGCTTMPGCVCH